MAECWVKDKQEKGPAQQKKTTDARERKRVRDIAYEHNLVVREDGGEYVLRGEQSPDTDGCAETRTWAEDVMLQELSVSNVAKPGQSSACQHCFCPQQYQPRPEIKGLNNPLRSKLRVPMQTITDLNKSVPCGGRRGHYGNCQRVAVVQALDYAGRDAKSRRPRPDSSDQPGYELPPGANYYTFEDCLDEVARLHQAAKREELPGPDSKTVIAAYASAEDLTSTLSCRWPMGSRC